MNIEQHCQLYLLQIEKFRLLTLLLSYDLNNIDLQVELLKLHYDIKENRKEMRKRLRCD
jgi:hypothetical protein